MKIILSVLVAITMSHSVFAQEPATPAPNLPSGTAMPTSAESPNSPADKALVDQSHQAKAGDLKKHADKKKKMKKMKNKKNGATHKLRKNKKNNA
ncbi:MAG: hypothetical protein H7Z71_05760 [Moraxellaceae bacterium]|nr:hypothetical protein [Pseudobdellovibrionaceae bacterium]